MSFITLLRPPFVYSRRAFSKPVVPPLGVAYLAASLRANGHQVEVIDALAEGVSRTGPTLHPQLEYRGLPVDAIVERISPQTDAIAISSMFALEWPHTEEMIRQISEQFPSKPVIVGGEHATATYEYILKTSPAVTCVVLGEGEETISEFADHLDQKRKLSVIAGIAYRQNSHIVKTHPRARIKDIDSIPLPAWDLIPLHKLHESGHSYGVYRGLSMPILATRGCPYECTFCSSPSMWTTLYYLRTPGKVVDEIELYLKNYQATNFDFYDLTAVIKRSWILEFCQEILKRNLKFSWQLPVGTRSEALDKEVLRCLYETGCKNIGYSPESGSERMLYETKKKISLNRLNRSLKEAVKTGIRVKVSLMIGFPDERRMEIYKTLLLMMKYAWVGIDDAAVYAFTPYPGSELYNRLREKKIIPELNNDYFVSLAGFFDLLAPMSYCEKVGPIELNFYRILGMSLFYFLTYVRKPLKIFKTMKNLLTNRSETVFEQKILEWLKRRAMRVPGRRPVFADFPAFRWKKHAQT